MKRLLIIICALLLSIGSWATTIKLIRSKKINAFERSLPIEPSASYDNNTIYLYSEVPLENLQVAIKNETGEILFCEYVCVSPQYPYTFSIGNVENGIYILELDDGKYKYHGFFEINQ